MKTCDCSCDYCREIAHIHDDCEPDCECAVQGDDEAERMLTEWAACFANRDAIVLAAYRAGVPKSRIHLLTGIARTTIDRIMLRASPTIDTGHEQHEGS